MTGANGRVLVDFARLRGDLKAHGFTNSSLPKILRAHFGTVVTRREVAEWWTAGTMTLQQFAELAHVMKLETGHTLNFWHYVSRVKPEHNQL